jgi:hypothetical protein
MAVQTHGLKWLGVAVTLAVTAHELRADLPPQVFPVRARTVVRAAWRVTAPDRPGWTERQEARSDLVLRPVTTTAAPDPTALADGHAVVEISEALLNRLVTHRETRRQPVRDFVLGADVFGQEETTTTVRIELQPSEGRAHAAFVLTGVTNSDTLGYTPQATVRTLGRHCFEARKDVVFDGELFQTRRPVVHVSPSNQTLSASTPVEGIPLIGPLAAQIAQQAAVAQTPQADAITVQKVSRGVGENFNAAIDAQLAPLNRGWSYGVRPPLAQAGWWPASQSLSSSDRALRWVVRFAGVGDASLPADTGMGLTWLSRRIGAAPREPARGPWLTRRGSAPADAGSVLRRPSADASRIAVHVGVFNAALESLNLAGTEFSPAEFERQIEFFARIVQDLSVEPIDPFPEGAAPPAIPPGIVVRLDAQRPLEIEAEADEIRVTARVAVTSPLGGAPTVLVVRLAYRIERARDVFELRPGEVTVSSADGNPVIDVLRPLMEQQVRSEIKPVRIPRRLRVPVPGQKSLELTIADVAVSEGWVAVTVE